jgi:SOS-response transcriptional repressor LexA
VKQTKTSPSPREAEFLVTVIDLSDARGIPPTTQEVAERMKVSPARARQVAEVCYQWRWARRDPGIPRSLTVTSEGRLAVRSSRVKTRG